jgi:ATP-binding cassette subfamily B multidrug efflux pump
VGPPGSGKSTLVHLLSRMHDVSGGRIRIDGVDIRSIRLEDLRAMIDVMPQEPFLFSGTVRDNITFGNPRVTETMLRDTVRRAALEEQIDQLPAGFDTRIGEKGVILSGGQRQRVALARALLRDAPILVLDDPISQVDTETAETIIRTIQAMRDRKTIIIVSHRIAALRFADNIFTMDTGRIVESGNHETLMAANGYYARICRLQEVEEGLHAQ